MLSEATVSKWLDDYVAAWKSYQPEAIGALFSSDAKYYYYVNREPVSGREAIIANWRENQDAPGSFEASYAPIALNGNLAVVQGSTRYFEPDGATVRQIWDNIFVLRFNDQGECQEFTEWPIKRP